MFSFIWFDVFYEPLYNALMFFYAIQPLGSRDMGLAVILLTVFMRFALLPFSIRAAQSEHRMALIRPEIDTIRRRYRHDIQKQRDETKKVLRQNKIGIMSNLISLGFQLLVFLVLYSIFSSGLQVTGKNILYPFNLDPGVISPYFLGRFNMIVPDWRISVFAAAVVLLHQLMRRSARKKASNSDDEGGKVLEQVLLVGMPLGIYVGTIVLPSAKALFIAASALFGIWLKIVRTIVLKYFVKDEELKQNVEKLWTN